MAKKKRKCRPKKKTLKRKDRLNVGKRWLNEFEGSNVVRSYKRKFKVDILCAIKELQTLEADLDPDYIERVKRSEEGRLNALRLKKEQKALEEDFYSDSDETFRYIAGYTSGGAPYGIRWDEEWDDEDDEMPF